MLIVGSAIVLAGIVMLVLPGPGLLAIFAGLALLATEFTWAARLLRWVKTNGIALAQRSRARIAGWWRRGKR